MDDFAQSFLAAVASQRTCGACAALHGAGKRAALPCANTELIKGLATVHRGLFSTSKVVARLECSDYSRLDEKKNYYYCSSISYSSPS